MVKPFTTTDCRGFCSILIPVWFANYSPFFPFFRWRQTNLKNASLRLRKIARLHAHLHSRACVNNASFLLFRRTITLTLPRTLLIQKCHVLGSPGAMMGSSVHSHVSASLVSIPLRCLILLIRAISLWAVVYFTHQMPDEIFRHRELGPITTNSW